MATSGYLDSIKITGGDKAAGTRKTRYLRFSWSVTGTEIGKTTIAWELKGYGGNNAYTDYGIQLNGEWVVPKTYNATVSYKETVITSGTKTYTHNASGAAAVSASIWVGQIWDVSEGTTSDSWALETNYPYTNCGAPDPSSITISPAIQKPGGKITISWDAGSEGKANAVASYKVQYKIGTGSWSSAYSTTTTSKDITLPTNAARGYAITARVMSIGAVSGYDSDYSKAGGSGRVNNLPGTPTVKSIDKTLIPSIGATVNFELTAGGVGTGDTGQTGSLYYATSSTGTKSVCNANFSPTVGATTTYYFWTYDGLEYSSSYASQKITVNTKPTVSLSISGTKANNETAIFTNGNNEQSTSNTYTFGFTYNNKDYTLVSAQTATSYNIGDMRKRLSDKLNSLTDNTTYSYKFWVYRNDGIEDSDKAISSNIALSIPKFTLLNDKDVAASFSKNVTISLSGASDGLYSTAALGTETPNGMILNTAGLNWGEKIEKILINGSFYVTPQTTLTKVHAIDMIASAGMTSPYTPNPFCTYTSQTLGISLASRLGAAYGVDSVPNLTVTSSKGKIEDIQGSGNDSTWTYSISGSQLYKLINSSAATLSLVFSIKNKFDDVFTKTFVLNLDNTAAAVTYFAKPIDLYPGTLDGKTSSPKYPSLNQWIYLKETMPFWLDFSVLAFDQPTFQFELYNFNNSGIWEKIGSAFNGTRATTTLSNYAGVTFNTPPASYTVTMRTLTSGLGGIVQDHNIKARIRVTTSKHEMVYDFFDGAALPIKAHQPSRAYFTKAEYVGGSLQTEWVVEDYGYSAADGDITYIDLQISERTLTGTRKTYPSSPEATWTNFTGFVKDEDAQYELLHIAPKLTSVVTTSTKTNVTPSYSNVFGTTKTTNSFLYIVVYNVAPTVSYRKNYVGINTTDFSQYTANSGVNEGYSYEDKVDVAFVIGAHNQHQSVYFKGSDPVPAKININDRTFHNFIIMGGSWDNTDNYAKPEVYLAAETTSF